MRFPLESNSLSGDRGAKKRWPRAIPSLGKLCRELIISCRIVECCKKDGSRPTIVAVQAEAVNHLSVPVQK